MPEIHAVLIEKQRIEAEEAQRLVAFARNASAGVATCLGGAENRRVAVEHYREVLRLDAAGATDGLGLRLDALQRLHALHNLKLALDAVDEEEAAFKIRHSESETPGEKTAVPYRGALPSAPLASPFAGVSRTLRDASLESDAALVRAEYLAKRAGGVGAALTAFRDAVKATNDARLRSGATGPGPAGATWWFAVLDREARRAPNNTNAANTNNAFVDRLARGALGGSWHVRAVAFTDAAGPCAFQSSSRTSKRVGVDARGVPRARADAHRASSKADPADVDAAGRCQVCVSLDGGGDGGGDGVRRGVSRHLDRAVVHAARRRRHCVAEAENASRGRRLRDQSDAAELYRARARRARQTSAPRHDRDELSRLTAAQRPPTKCQDEVYICVGHFRVPRCADTQGSGSAGSEYARGLKIGGGAHLETMEGIRREFRCASTLLRRQSLELGARRARDGDDADQRFAPRTRWRRRAFPTRCPNISARPSCTTGSSFRTSPGGMKLDRAIVEADLRKAASQVGSSSACGRRTRPTGARRRRRRSEKSIREWAAEGGPRNAASRSPTRPCRDRSTAPSPFTRRRRSSAPCARGSWTRLASAAQLIDLPCGHGLVVTYTDASRRARLALAAIRVGRAHDDPTCPTCRELGRDSTRTRSTTSPSGGGLVPRTPRGDGDEGLGFASSTWLELEKAVAAALSSHWDVPEEHEPAIDPWRCGSWGTKIEAVTRSTCLWSWDRHIRISDAATKVLVFF